MKKYLSIILCLIILTAAAFFVLNINVTTRQGINYQWHTVKIPLYLKLLDFFDRHYNYKELVKRITLNAKDDRVKAMRIFEWTCNNLKRAPQTLPVVDDHVWHIIVRGYGARDQFSDVFSTLCNYAGLDAFYTWVYTQERTSRIPLSFVELSGKWFIFDPYNGAYFTNAQGLPVDIDAIKLGNSWRVKHLRTEINPTDLDVDYSRYFGNFPDTKKAALRKANIQSPVNRLFFEIQKRIK
ncbi:MAG: transglutaminase domain-containing protein [Candidatus Omnitrophota bacterium]